VVRLAPSVSLTPASFSKSILMVPDCVVASRLTVAVNVCETPGGSDTVSGVTLRILPA